MFCPFLSYPFAEFTGGRRKLPELGVPRTVLRSAECNHYKPTFDIIPMAPKPCYLTCLKVILWSFHLRKKPFNRVAVRVPYEKIRSAWRPAKLVVIEDGLANFFNCGWSHSTRQPNPVDKVIQNPFESCRFCFGGDNFIS